MHFLYLLQAKTYDFEKEHRDRMRSQGLLAEPQNTESHAAVKQEVIASMHQQIIKLRKENRTCQEQNEIARSSEVEVRRLMAALKSKHENELKILKSKMKVQERELHNQVFKSVLLFFSWNVTFHQYQNGTHSLALSTETDTLHT